MENASEMKVTSETGRRRRGKERERERERERKYHSDQSHCVYITNAPSLPLNRPVELEQKKFNGPNGD